MSDDKDNRDPRPGQNPTPDQEYLRQAYASGGRSDDRIASAGKPSHGADAAGGERSKEVPSDEADRRQLALAREEGDAYHRSLLYMANEVAHTGAMKRAGDYIVAYAQEKAEGMYRPGRDGKLEWVEPEDENCHLEISVSDAGDQRFIPGLKIDVELKASNGETIGPFTMPFLWHPGLYHYGRNIKVPGNGRYELKVRIAAPDFPRHDKDNGKRYAEDVEVTFEKVDIETGSE